ncbi:L-pipecolate oxidase [Lasiodiplodia hormozganensis]|uniref:L-pipecolate oxidase n=1 Tax=Lasiodiplodia hormozganensis TaxID=869390 RepID=A0AA39XRH4_9PEZI|nr:L-pipecolate oxidase [Lasiodiplodia hormozganensis]
MDSVIIVGCGVFGLSTGLALSKRYPSSKITFIDRHEPPVPDGTSVDTTRVIRADYHDPVYSELALESQRLIQQDAELGPHYYRSGMIYAHSGAGRHGSQVWEKEYASAQALQKKRIESGEFSAQGYLRHLTSNEAIFKRVNGQGFEPHAGEKQWNEGYLNEDVAFVNAEECMRVYYHKCRRQANASFLFGNPVKRVIIEGGVAKGVELADGKLLTADLVILATGAWTNTLLDLRDQVTSTGHEVAWLKLSPEMEERYKNMPITTNFATGFNIFPPLNGEIKCLRRSPGYTNTRTVTDSATGKSFEVSAPPDSPSTIPADAEKALRANLAELFPPLAEQPFDRTKLCFFTNTPTSDFLVDRHPTIKQLALVTGGSAHGWKFLCVLGDRVVDMLEGKLEPELQKRWKYKQPEDKDHNMEGAPRAQGEKQELKHCKPIAIIGAGVFGLSTALHLAKSGYKDITIFDYQPYDQNGYSTTAGCDAASADENKILRASYGDRKIYQDLAFSAIPIWESWNSSISSSSPTSLPTNLHPTDTIWVPAGFLRLSDNGLDEHEAITQRNFPAAIKHTQYHINDASRAADAVSRDGIPATKLDPFGRRARGLPVDGVLDATGGYVLASKACAWALHLCAAAGVKLRLGPEQGRYVRHATGVSPTTGKRCVTGVVTADGTTHPASLVVVACGGWTPALLPDADELLETTAGSVLTVRIPKDERPDLWDKFAPENFPVWSWKMASYGKNAGGENRTSVGGLYGFPRTPDGVVKFGFRGAKWTNYAHERDDGSGKKKKKVSFPKTGGGEVPEKAMEVVEKFCEENLPDLLTLPIETARLCWYTDSVDNDFLVDYVPGTEGLVVCSGGSGHGFKFLPVLGSKVVEVIEGKKDSEYVKAWRWRERPTDKANGLEEGPSGWRTLDKQRMVNGWKDGKVAAKL